MILKLSGNIDMAGFIEKLIEKNLLDKEKLDNFLDKIAEKAAEKLAEYLINQDKEEDSKKDKEPDKKPEWEYYPERNIALMYGCVYSPYKDDDFKITTITTKKVDESPTFDACNITEVITDKVEEEEIGEDKEFVDDFDYENFEEKDIEDKEKNKELCDNFNKYTMRLTPLEYARYKKFEKNHLHRETNTGAIGGSLSLNLTMTSIGVGKSCECSICKKTANITEYNW